MYTKLLIYAIVQCKNKQNRIQLCNLIERTLIIIDGSLKKTCKIKSKE